MLYDELVPQGEYLAHYGVPKDQWSPEARARHNRNHPQKGDVPPTAYRQVYENIRGAYDEYQNNNYNRGGNRSTFGSKVDEHRAQAAEARRRNRRGAGYQTQSKPDDGQHTSSYRKPNRTETKPNLPNKPHSLPETTGGKVQTVLNNAINRARDRYHGKTSSGKNADNNTWTVTPGYKSDPALENVRRQLNRADTIVNNRPRSLRDYSHNGQLVKQNPTLNSFAAENGGSPNNIRLSTKAKKVSKNTNAGNRPGKTSSRTSKPTPSSQSADQAIARNMRPGSSTKKNRKDQPNKKGNGSKKK